MRTIDPLNVSHRRFCPACKNKRRARRKCESCGGSGYEKNDSLEGLWAPTGGGFLVCGGPSLNTNDLSRLGERGVVSLAVNNSAGHAPVRAWCFSDPQYKFHHGLFLDPDIITMAPTPKLGKHVRVKLSDGSFRFTSTKLFDCPNTWGFQRRTMFDGPTFFSTTHAHWGYGGKQGEDRSFSTINTMFLGLRLLHYLGPRKIFLLGVDFKREPDAFYAWPQDKGGGGGWKKSIKLFKMLQPHLKAAGVEIFNCNPTSALEVFPHVPYDQAIRECKGLVPDEPFDLAGWYNKGSVRIAREEMKKPEYKHLELF